jgi:predicted transposase YbfD/YdcC
MVEAERLIKGVAHHERRYYISSLQRSAVVLNDAVRAHWGVENELYWVLDVAFQEDASRVRVGASAQNFSMLRHIALNLLKGERTANVGVKAKRLKAGWSDDYLLKVLAQ